MTNTLLVTGARHSLTSSNTDELDAWVGFKPDTPAKEGVRRLVEWYRTHYARREVEK